MNFKKKKFVYIINIINLILKKIMYLKFIFYINLFLFLIK